MPFDIGLSVNVYLQNQRSLFNRMCSQRIPFDIEARPVEDLRFDSMKEKEDIRHNRSTSNGEVA